MGDFLNHLCDEELDSIVAVKTSGFLNHLCDEELFAGLHFNSTYFLNRWCFKKYAETKQVEF